MKKAPDIKELYLGKPCYIIGSKRLDIEMRLNNSKYVPCVEKSYISRMYYTEDRNVAIDVGSPRGSLYLNSPSSIEGFFLDLKEAEEYCLAQMKKTLKEAVEEAKKYAKVVEDIEKLIRNKEFGEF